MCSADLLSLNPDRATRNNIQIAFSSIKLLIDILMIGLGVFYFYKLCSFDPATTDNEDFKKQDIRLIEQYILQLEKSILKNIYFQGIIYLLFVAFLVRVCIKDIVFVLLDIDYWYLKNCRC